MLKTKENNSNMIDFEKKVMTKVSSGQIVMKPRWYFVAGSLLATIGLIGLSIGAIFLINISLFLLRSHGPMGQWRLELMLSSFPLWVPFLAVLAIILGIWLLKKYDFSYKKNFLLIIISFTAAIIVSAFLIDYFGFNETWSRQGPMRRFYQQLEQGQPQNGRGNRFNRQNQ